MAHQTLAVIRYMQEIRLTSLVHPPTVSDHGVGQVAVPLLKFVLCCVGIILILAAISTLTTASFSSGS